MKNKNSKNLGTQERWNSIRKTVGGRLSAIYAENRAKKQRGERISTADLHFISLPKAFNASECAQALDEAMRRIVKFSDKSARADIEAWFNARIEWCKAQGANAPARKTPAKPKQDKHLHALEMQVRRAQNEVNNAKTLDEVVKAQARLAKCTNNLIEYKLKHNK